jgi:SOS response regulatory protein OraA/RecX
MGEHMHPQSRTFALALKLLKARDRFESEVRGSLTAASSPPSEIDEAITALRTLGFIDDVRLSCSVAQRLSSQKHWSRARIEEHLRVRGAPTDCIGGLPDDRDTAAAVVKKSRLSGVQLARRLVSYGFDEDLVSALCDSD